MLQKYLDGQYRRPSGWVGRWVGGKMAQQHQPENLWTLGCLDAQPDQHILEVGFGPGFAIQQLCQSVPRVQVSGVDFSSTMVAAARRRNAQAVRSGQVQLKQADIINLPFADRTFDQAFSIHSIYFWPQPLIALQEIRRVLKPNGQLVLTILPKERWPANADGSKGTAECIPYSADDLRQFLSDCGYTDTAMCADENVAFASNYSVIARA
jgi:ubiquinone/menaquinone biosynthesis C-methylase UbiE